MPTKTIIPNKNKTKNLYHQTYHQAYHHKYHPLYTPSLTTPKTITTPKLQHVPHNFNTPQNHCATNNLHTMITYIHTNTLAYLLLFSYVLHCIYKVCYYPFQSCWWSESESVITSWNWIKITDNLGSTQLNIN